VKLAAVRVLALSLPEVTEEPHHQFDSFRVRGKIFITVPPDQQHVHVFVSEEHREQALALYPEFAEKLLWGGKVVGVRVSLTQAQASAVKSLVLQAWEHKAPKALLAGRGTPGG
jgi:hypothetical protein